MSASQKTIADPTVIDQVSVAARLIVYIDTGASAPQSKVVPLPESTDVTVGRSRGCTVTLESDRISRKHFRVRKTGGTIEVEDLGSRNGTKVNGAVIDGIRILTPGDEISAGPLVAVLTTTGSVLWRRNSGGQANLHARLAAEVDRGKRYKRTFALAMVRLTGDDAQVDAGLAVMHGALRAMDDLTEYTEDDCALVLPELDGAQADEILRQLFSTVRESAQVSLHAGIAIFPQHAANAEALIEYSRTALRTAIVTQSPFVQERSDPKTLGGIVAEAHATRSLFALVDKVAEASVSVLVLGETGAGKEVVCARLHQTSARARGPFVAVNCACISPSLLESELFGHEKGAFTGALRQKTGLFEAADGGTLFLDEIGEMDLSLQSKLLRALETKTIMRVGSTETISIDTRLVCATHQDLEVEVKRGRFRADLYYRIAGFTLLVPPLRERREDIEPLANAFLAENLGALRATPTLASDAVQVLQNYGWPGNVRELRNALERAIVVHRDGIITAADLPPEMTAATTSPVPLLGVSAKIARVEREAIELALDESAGNQTRAARKLGITRRALIYRMEKHGLKAPPKSSQGGEP